MKPGGGPGAAGSQQQQQQSNMMAGSALPATATAAGDQEILRKGPWMPEEDEILVEYVRQFGPRDWSSIRSKGLLPRTGKSCRLRWVNKLKPDLKRSGCKFSPEEEKLVVEMQAKLGNKWAKIASYLPGRTDNDVKNFWSTRQKRLLRAMQRPKGSGDQSQPQHHSPNLLLHSNTSPFHDPCTMSADQAFDHHLSKDSTGHCFVDEFAAFQVQSPSRFGAPCWDMESQVDLRKFNMENDVFMVKLQDLVPNESVLMDSSTELSSGTTGGVMSSSNPSNSSGSINDHHHADHMNQAQNQSSPSSSSLGSLSRNARSVKSRRPRSRRDPLLQQHCKTQLLFERLVTPEPSNPDMLLFSEVCMLPPPGSATPTMLQSLGLQQHHHHTMDSTGNLMNSSTDDDFKHEIYTHHDEPPTSGNNYLDFLLHPEMVTASSCCEGAGGHDDDGGGSGSTGACAELPSCFSLSNNQLLWEKLPLLYPEEPTMRPVIMHTIKQEEEEMMMMMGSNSSSSCTPDSVLNAGGSFPLINDVFDSLEPLSPSSSPRWWHSTTATTTTTSTTL